MSLLNRNNYLNLVGYILNVVVTFAASPLFQFPDNAELSEKYQTLVTPAGTTFTIWGVIFIAQAIFTVAQATMREGEQKLVQDGVSYWYFAACLFQCGWTFAFGYEVIGLSVVFMACVFISLLQIVIAQSSISSSADDRIKDFWLFKFPFSVHFGWIAVAFPVNLNVLLVASGISASGQLVAAYATLIYAVFIAIFALFFFNLPDFTIPSVLVWATLGIVMELNETKQKIENAFEAETIEKFKNWTLAICIILGVVTAAYGALRVYRNGWKGDKNTTPDNKAEEYDSGPTRSVVELT